ncbi:MAG TPA: S8/S53 family peptidase [Acidimicrobiia bacterium]|nr:S8/S53 family peptidase [Acidimicrobiia bacterium]
MAAKSDASSKRNGQHEGCHSIPGVLAVHAEDVRSASNSLKDLGGARDATRRILSRYLPERDKDRSTNVPIGILAVGDAHEAAAFLATLRRPIAASPIHGVGFEGHRGFMSGAGPKPAKPFTANRPLKTRGVIAVVDSGIVDPKLRPKWMQKPFVLHDREDIEKVDSLPASHGTFVTSIIRQVAPDYAVSIAAAPPDTDGVLVTSMRGNVIDPPTTELDVLGAIVRLVARHGANPSEVKALNLSLGASACGAHDGFLLTIEAALDYWRQHFGQGVPIYAAGGNSPDLRPVYPGAFACVKAVAAGANGGKQQVWDDGTARNAPPRSWITDVAPGVWIRGLSGKSVTDTVSWSGSSFATAVASALAARGDSFEVDGATTYWQDRGLVYGDVDGLHF